MPRKRKGPKREPSEGDQPPPPLPPPPATSTSTHLQANPTIAGPSRSASSMMEDSNTNANKRARHLTDVEENRLGKLVGLERWIESVGHGRGAAVCICGQLDPETPTAAAAMVIHDTFTIDLSCLDPNNPAHRSTLSLTFTGQLARNVAEPLLLLHRLGPPAVVYISGFAADVVTRSHAIFEHEKVVIKMSPQPSSADPTAPTSALWVEQLASPPAFTSTAHPARTVSAPLIANVGTAATEPRRSLSTSAVAAEPSPPSQLTDWFATPAPSGNAPIGAATAAASTSALTSLPPPPPLRPVVDSTRAFVTAGGPATIKSEAQTGPSSSSSSSPRPSRALSRQASAAPPAPPRRNAPNVKPRRMGNCLYTPMSMVRDGERASVIGVVVAAGDPRRSSGGTRDLSIKITIADASCLSGTGYAKELARSMTVMLFAQQTERIPQNVKPGHIVAVRSVHIQMFSGKPQAVGKSAANWSWATYDPVSGDVRASSNFPLASHTPPECSAEEMEHFRDMANWFSELQGVDANIMTRSSRPTLKLQDIGENTFFDTVVEVLKVYTHTLAPDLYVTDYTKHSLFYRGNDKYLRHESEVPYPDDTDGWGHVFQISLWDSHATIAEGLQTGDIIRIQNVRPKLNPRGLLTGGLGSNTDSGIKIRTLKPTDEARIELEQRRARFMQTLFAAEEEAFADRAERDFGGAPQQGPSAGRSAQQGEADRNAGSDGAADVNTVSARQGAAAEGEGSRNVAIAQSGTGAVPPGTTGMTGPPAQRVTTTQPSPASSTQPPFPTPAQRQVRALQEATPSKTADRMPTALGSGKNGNRTTEDLSLIETPDVKPNVVMGPPDVAVEERRPLIRCNAPASIPLTALAELPTTSLCPGMFKVKARIISTNPAKVEQWGRAECKACKRLLPLDQRFCIKCGDEEGESLSFCFRFAMMLEEVDSEFVARKQQSRADGTGTSLKKTAIPLLFHGRMAEVLLPCVDAKALYNGERSAIKTLKRFHNRLLHPNEYMQDPEQILAVYSYPNQESGRTVRRFAALKELNCLYSPRDLL